MKNLFILTTFLLMAACEQKSVAPVDHKEEKVDAIITHVFALKKTDRTIQSEKTNSESSDTIKKKL